MSIVPLVTLHPPNEFKRWEHLNVILWRKILNDPAADTVGRSGQEQNGCDIFGRWQGNINEPVSIQAKLKKPGQAVTTAEIDEEIKKSRSFKPSIKELYIVTTAEDDAKLEQHCRLRSQKESFKVHYLGWDKLLRRIYQYNEAMEAFDPSDNPRMKAISETLDSIKTSINSVMTTLPLGHNSATGNSSIGYFIDDVSEFLNDAAFSDCAVTILEGILNRHRHSLDKNTLFRLVANIGFFSDGEKSRNALLAAIEMAPSEEDYWRCRLHLLILEGAYSEILTDALVRIKEANIIHSIAIADIILWVLTLIEVPANIDFILPPIEDMDSSLAARFVQYLTACNIDDTTSVAAIKNHHDNIDVHIACIEFECSRLQARYLDVGLTQEDVLKGLSPSHRFTPPIEN